MFSKDIDFSGIIKEITDNLSKEIQTQGTRAIKDAVDALLSNPIVLDGKKVKVEDTGFKDEIKKQITNLVISGTDFNISAIGAKKMQKIDISKFVDLDSTKLISELDRINDELKKEFDDKKARKLVADFTGALVVAKNKGADLRKLKDPNAIYNRGIDAEVDLHYDAEIERRLNEQMIMHQLAGGKSVSRALSNAMSSNQIKIFDGVKEYVYDAIKDFDALNKKLDEIALKMKTPVFHAGNLDKDVIGSGDYVLADSLKKTLETGQRGSIGSGTFAASNYSDVSEWYDEKGAERLYAFDLSKYSESMLKLSSEEEVWKYAEFLGAITDLAVYFVNNDSKSLKRLGSNSNPEDFFNNYKEYFDKFNIKFESFNEWLNQEVEFIKGFNGDTSKMANVENISTDFQKKLLGVNGVDVTASALDDSAAIGNVVFNIDSVHPFDIDFGSNKEIANLFYQKVLDKILVNKASNATGEDEIREIMSSYQDAFSFKENSSEWNDLFERLRLISQGIQPDQGLETIKEECDYLLNEAKQINIQNGYLEDKLSKLREIQTIVRSIEELLESSEDYDSGKIDNLNALLERFGEEYSQIKIFEDGIGESVIDPSDYDSLLSLMDYNFKSDSSISDIEFIRRSIQDVAQEAEVAKTSMEEIPKAISDASSANEDMVETTQNVVAAEENLRDVSENISDIKKQEVVDSSPTVDSVEESVPALQEESKALAELTQETEKATASKEEFAKANASTKDSAENSFPALNNEAEAMKKVNEASNQKAQKKSRAEKEADDYVKWWEKALKLRDIKEKSQIKSGAAYAERVDAERDAKEQARRDKAAADREKLEQRYNDVWSKAQKDRAAKEEAAAEKAQKAADKAAEAQASRQQSINDGANNSIENSLNYLNGINTSKYTSDFASTITSLKKELGDLSTKNLDYTIESNKDNLDEVLDKVENVKIALKQNKDSISLASYKQIESTYSKISSSGKYYDSLSGEGRAKYDELLSKAQSFRGASEVTKEELASLDEEIIRFNNDLKGMGVSTGYVENIMGGLSTTLKSLGARYLSLYRIVGYLRSAVTTVKDLDSALTELRKVADASTARLNQTLQTSTKTAKELGSTVSDVINVTAD